MRPAKQTLRLTSFLATFYPDEAEVIRLRALPPHGASITTFNRPEKLSAARRRLGSDQALQRRLKNLNSTRGLFFVVNSGGEVDASISRFNACFVEKDSLSIPEQHTLLDRSPVPPSIRVETRRSVHAYWLIDGECSAERWREIQERLIAFFDGDRSITNPSRLMRLPFFEHLHYDDATGHLERKRVEVVEFEPTRRYAVGALSEAFPAVEERKSERLSTGNRANHNDCAFETWEELKAELKRRMLSDSTCTIRGEWAHLRGRCHDGRGTTAISFNLATGAYSCAKGCDSETILRSFGLPETPHGEEAMRYEHAIPQWPAPPDAPAFHGLAGEIVRTIEPHTEADPIALLIQLIVAFGNAIGRNAHFVADGAEHSLNLFGVLVGATSKGRKGTSWSHVHRLMQSVDASWAASQILSGLSSGEGVIWAVRDPTIKRGKEKPAGGYDEVIVEQGVSDKRLLVLEAEFTSVLRVLAREGNTLSATLRQAWDTGDLRVLTKNSPAHSTGAHISIIGHVTRDELLRYLDATESGNGFGNRFLWVCIQRSKLLPEGGGDVRFGGQTQLLRKAIEFGCSVGRMERDALARELWRDVYPNLSEGKRGLFGAIIARAEAQTMRLAAIYALLDRSPVIGLPHLEAALALWRYCEDSARFVFGDAQGDPVADEILRALHETADVGLTRTQIRDLFGRNRRMQEITRGLRRLAEAGLARSRNEETGGRPSERWFGFSLSATNTTTKTTKTIKAPAEDGMSTPSVVSVVPNGENRIEEVTL